MIKAKVASKNQKRIREAYFSGVMQGRIEGLNGAASVLRAKGVKLVEGENGQMWFSIRGGMHPLFSGQK